MRIPHGALAFIRDRGVSRVMHHVGSRGLMAARGGVRCVGEDLRSGAEGGGEDVVDVGVAAEAGERLGAGAFGGEQEIGRAHV